MMLARRSKARSAISSSIRSAPHILHSPRRSISPWGVIAYWGDVTLSPLDTRSLAVLAAGQSVTKGMLFDFLGNFGDSAREGLPIFQLGGASGYVWGARFDENGRGSLRMTAIDTSQFTAPASVANGGDIDSSRMPSRERRSSVSRGDTPSPGPQPEVSLWSGTGFFVSKEGHVLTNKHVIEKCTSIRVFVAQSEPVDALEIASDTTNDLALLSTRLRPHRVAAPRLGLRLGETVAAFGYPYADILATSGNFTQGNVTALAGMRDDSRYVQISAPVQPGNSGGPLLDQNGRLIAKPAGRLSMADTDSILDALGDPDLFAPHFKGPSWKGWKVFLAALFALPMDDDAAQLFRQCTGRSVAPAGPFTEAALIVGRRGGKSRVLALIATYLACFRDYAPHLAPGELATIAVLAANKAQARSIFRYVIGLLKAVPLIEPLIEDDNTETITLSNRVVIEIATASFRTTRGYSFAACLADEVAFWRSDESSANPDVEIMRALRPGMASIPGSILLLASSPYAKKVTAYDRALALNHAHVHARHRRGDAYLALGKSAAAHVDFSRAAASPHASVWSHIHAARTAAADGDFERSFHILVKARPKWIKSAPYRSTVKEVIEQYFAAKTRSAMTLYDAGDRDIADAYLLGTLDEVRERIEQLEDLPPIVAPAPDGHIAILANQDLAECKHYRVEQKLRQLHHAGFETQLFDQHDVLAFIDSLLGARAALFYRVPAFPGIMRAILTAKALGIPTYYEIDDLIFDAPHYPDTLLSYEGQISKADYNGLLYGVPFPLCNGPLRSRHRIHDDARS
jgi:Trypsin-like peptidase domain